MIVKKLVKEGRFEFLNGGWVASDEACPTFEDLILNIATGHEFLRREFGIRKVTYPSTNLYIDHYFFPPKK